MVYCKCPELVSIVNKDLYIKKFKLKCVGEKT